MKKNALSSVAAAVAICAFSSPTAAQEVAGIFSKGRTHFIISGGTGYAFDETYFVLGAGVTYYLIDGLNVGLQVESWSGSDPGIVKITPSLGYVFHQGRGVKPYVAAFYRRTRIEDREDLDSVGGRAGLYFQAGRNGYLGVGAVYESYLDCKESVYRKCDSTYPEVSFTFAF